MTNNKRNPDRYPLTYYKQKKYLRACLLAWKGMGAKIDLLDASEEDWLNVWGKDPKTPNMCYEGLRDTHTGRIMVNYTTPLRWIMQNSRDPHVQRLIISKDQRFDTKKLKREKGVHKESYFTEEQCFLLPFAINNIDTLLFTYFGQLFGGRSIALRDLTPARIKYNENRITLFESKVQRYVDKELFEPERTLLKQYIMDMGIKIDQPLFARNEKRYNEELSATKKWFENTEHPLSWKPTSHTALKHTCVTQMSLHGVRLDTISDYIGTDPNTLRDYYRGGSSANIKEEIGGITVKHQAPTWRAFVIQLTQNYAKRYEELTGRKVVLPTVKEA